ncbi:MAG: metal ABC transporter solute-binding protein, Zn/Mn family [Solirubrobacteraceae bacterium]
MLEPFRLPYVQRALVEVVVLSVGAGILGTWIVLRGLAFYAHAVGTAAFPGLVLANGLNFAAPLGAFASGGVFAGTVARLARRERTSYDALTALVLVGALATGVILASDVFHSGGGVEQLLFGSLLAIGWNDVVLAAVASGLVLVAGAMLGRRWLATGFDPGSAPALGLRSALPDLILLGLIALATTAALSAVGALLATALFVVPAATTRLWSRRMLPWQVATVALVAVEAIAGLWLSVETDAPPGATIGVLSSVVFGLAAAARHLRQPGKRFAVSTAVLALIGLAGCGGSGGSGASSGTTLDVVATTTQLGDFVREVGGSRVDVHQILKANSDPHDYEPRPSDVQATASATVVFLSGDNLDSWMDKVSEEAGGSPTRVVVSDAVPVKVSGNPSGPEASTYDPHWWHDPVNAKAAVKLIAAALSAADPKSAAVFKRNAAAYERKLAALQAGIASCLKAVPATQRKLVTDHDAFNYFAKRFGIAIVGAVIPSQSTQAQPSAGDLAKLSSVIKKQGVRAIFPESSLNPKLAQAIATQTGATSSYTLYGDTLGPAGSAGATYLTMEEANAEAMTRGLTGGRRGCVVRGL